MTCVQPGYALISYGQGNIIIKVALQFKPKRLRKKLARFRRSRLYKLRLRLLVMVLAIGLTIFITMARETENYNYAGLLDTIAKGESKGNYNAYFGHTHNADIRFTQMTVGEVLAWQSDYVKNGSPSSAVGKYQFVRPTLNGLVQQQRIPLGVRFDEALQDRLAVTLLERRGLKDYAKSKITREQFAHNLSKEWAALPRVIGDNPHQSYYAGDGLNKVQLSIDEIYRGIDSLREPPTPAKAKPAN